MKSSEEELKIGINFATRNSIIVEKEMTMRKQVKWSLMSVLWLVNPIVGCSQEEGFSFGEDDMLALLDEVNQETWVFEVSEERFELQFTLVPRESEMASLHLSSIFTSAHACGSRSFFAEASACIDTSDLPVEGTVNIIDVETGDVIQGDLAVEGSLEILGLDLDNASMYLNHEGGSFYFVDGTETEEVDLILDSAEW